MKKYKIIALAVPLIFIFNFSSCGKKEQKKISVFYSTYDDEYINSIRANLDRSFAKSRDTVTENYNANYDSNSQLRQFQSAIDSGTDLAIINLVSSDMNSIVSICEIAKESNVPVIFFESPVPWQVSEINNETVVITTDFKQLGKSLGGAIGEYLIDNYDVTDKNSDGKISYVMYKPEESLLEEYDISKYCVEETDSVLAKEGKPAIEYYEGTQFGSIISIGGTNIKEYAKDSIKRVLEEGTKDKRKMPEIIICANDTMALGVAEGVKDYGKEILIFGTDGTESLKKIASDTLIIPTDRNEKKVSDAVTDVAQNFLKSQERLENISKQYIVNNHLVKIPFDF